MLLLSCLQAAPEEGLRHLGAGLGGAEGRRARLVPLRVWPNTLDGYPCALCDKLACVGRGSDRTSSGTLRLDRSPNSSQETALASH